MILNVGDRIRHTTFGEGLVTKYESSTDIATIVFTSDNKSKRFLLSCTPLEKIGEYKTPPEKIKEHKSPRIYTTEFKIEVVKQVLSEGRTATRKQHDLPEATLRRWIRELG